MRNYILVLLAAVSMLTACKKDHDNTPGALTGTWAEQERTPQFAGTHYTLRVRADGGFDMSVEYFTDIANGNPCESRTEYVRGNWHTDGSKIVLNGYYTDHTFTQNQPEPCTGQTDYSVTFSYQLYRPEILILNPQLDDYSSVYLVQQ